MKEITIHYPEGVRLLIVTIGMINKKMSSFCAKKTWLAVVIIVILSLRTSEMGGKIANIFRGLLLIASKRHTLNNPA